MFTAESTGHTRLVFDLTWGGLIVRTIGLDVYVNEEPVLAYACPRHCDRYEYTDDGYWCKIDMC